MSFDPIELFWPRLNRTADPDPTLDRDRDLIRKTRWGKQIDAALEEAIRLANREEDRRRSADTKASAYLAVVAALMPLVATILSSIWEDKFGTAPKWACVLLVCAAILYTARSGIWAFHALEVRIAHRIDVSSLAGIWTGAGTKERLVKETFWATRQNRVGINEKVTSVKMAHAFLFRALIAFVCLLLFSSLWFVGNQAQTIWKPASAARRMPASVAPKGASPPAKPLVALPTPTVTAPVGRPRAGTAHP